MIDRTHAPSAHRRRLSVVIFVAAMLIVWLLATPASAALPPGPETGSGDIPVLFAGSAPGRVGWPGLAGSRARFVRVDLDALRSPQIVLNLYENVTFTARLDHLSPSATGGYVWIGRLEGVADSSAILSVQDQVMVGSITLPDQLYQVRYAGDGIHVIVQADASRLPAEADPIPIETASQSPAQSLAADDCGTIDMLVVYTPAARATVGGGAAMQAMINLAIQETNQGYANSQVVQRMNLVHTEEVAYDEASFDWNTTLNRLRSSGDGYLDNVPELRDTYHADGVTLIVNNDSYCGMGYLMAPPSASFAPYAYNLVSQSCATGYYSFAHENGHNMGTGHDRANSCSGAYSYSCGYQAPDKSFRTIMAYNCSAPGCPRVNYWSNPNVNYNGQPTGVPSASADSADNHLTLNNTACIVANFRARPGLPTAPMDLAAVAISSTQIGLSWTDASSDEESFKIERSPNGATGWTEIGSSPAGTAQYSDTGLTCLTPYYYRVRAYNTTGYSGYSNTATTTTLTCPPAPPAPFDKLGPADGATGIAVSPNLSWDASAGATGYEYCYDPIDNSSCDTSWVSATVSTSATLGRLANSTTYYWQVRARNEGGATGADSGTWWHFTTIDCPDSFEPDNVYTSARLITVNGSPQAHTIHTAGDADWARFTAQAGARYTIHASSLGANNDTILDLYNTDGTSLITLNDNCWSGTLGSCLNWQAPANGTYYLRVYAAGSSGGGCTGHEYSLSVAILKWVFLPVTLK